MTNQRRDERFDVVFSGRELLCVAEPMEPRPARPRHRPAREHRDEQVMAAERAAVLACFQQRPCSRGEIRYVTGMSDEHLAVAMNRLQREGLIVRNEYGLWRAVQ